MIKISSAFDAGAIEVVAAQRSDDIRVNIRADSHAEFRQWFYFRLQGAAGQACRIRFSNAGRCTYVDGWRDYRAVMSYDRRNWARVPTSFDGSEMTVVGDDVEASGIRWRHVKAPDGITGYVPAEYVVSAGG